ncbi:uncharacterized protein [Littorina saxatilis]|uniref:uncharacterized protein n=1 Tax=Littorina saxatilis TaxID=31220 RepID=UPI0038B512F1
MFSFPDLNGTFNLTQIRLDRASIKVVPPGICHHRPWLKSFDIHSNKITMIPDLSSCNMLLNLNLGNNQLLTLEGKPFQGLTQLRDLTLNHNKFNHIPADAFFGLTKLQYLDLAHNMIKTIHPSAFLSLNSIEDLNLGDNKIQALPTQGLQSLQKLKTFDNEDLRDFPLKEAFPKVYNLVLNYAYHCCDFLQSASLPTDTVEMVDEKVTWLRNGKEGAEDVWQEHYYNLTEFWTTHFDNHTPELWEDIQNNEYDPDEYDFSKEAEIYLEDYETGHGDVYVKNLVVAKPPVTCKPKPGPFMPCDDLFGWWSLRCGVWFVFMLALLGNAVVLFVSVSSRTKMDVPRFLICNLACADFCMGVYLGILAMVDASTLGEFRKHAIQWQISGGCLVAGFLGVLSSELSVFTLTVITLERFYAITHAMQLNKRLSLRQAGYVMLGGWLWTITLASLPLFGISDYRKFAICLPFEVEDIISKSYVCFILVFNGVSFCIILACYLCMYLSIRHSQAWNSNDTRVAKRMALLVFTDFLCWAPIAFFSIGASFGKNLIDLSGAKVLTIFVLPLNSCANPFLYAIFTKQFKRDCVLLCRRLEDSSIARHFSRVSNRHASLTWGSSRRPSQLHSLVNGEKGGSCSHSMSAGSALGGGVVYHSDPDSGKGSLDYEKVPQSDTPSSHEGCNCHLAANNKGDAEEGGRDYNTTNAYNEMLTRCNLQNTRADEGGTCSWQCRDCHVIMHQQHNAYTTSGGGGGGGGGRTTRLSSDDYNCTTETYLPNSDVDQDPPPGNASNAHRQRQHQHRGGNGNKKSSNSGGSRGHKEREEACGKAGCGCSKEKKKQRGGAGGEKRSRKELVVPVITFTKGGTDKVDIHSPRGGGTEGVTRCCRGGDRGGGDGGAEDALEGRLNEHHHHRHNHHHHHHHQRHHHDPSCTSSPTPPLPGPNNNDTHTSPAPTTTKITVTQHSGDVTQDDVMVKPDDADSGHDIGIDGGSAYRGSSIDDGVAEMGGGNGEFEHGEGDDREEAEGEDRNAHRGESLNVQGHGAGSSSRNAKSANQAPNPAATSNTATIAPCRRVLDKSEHMRFFTDSLTALPHACRSNSLVELTQTSQAKLTAPLHAPRGAPKRLSLTPRQEGFLFLNNVAADDNSPYLDDEEDPEFPPYEELQRYLHASKKHKGRAHALDRSAAQQDEVSGLLEGSNSASPSHAPDGVKSLKAVCFDKKSGFSSEY